MTTEQQLPGCCVLIVEDDYFIAEDSRMTLEDAGARVIGPCAAFEATRALLGDTLPDCAVVDLNLGQGPDFTIARYLREQGIPVLLVTGYDRGFVPSDLSAVECLQKPVNRKKLVKAVIALCED